MRYAEAAAQYDLDTRTILVEAGRRGMVGGQEDMTTGIALGLVSRAGEPGPISPVRVRHRG